MSSVSQNVSKRERAAVLLAEDELTDEAIAAAVGITRRTLTRWKRDPDFAALVGDKVGRVQAAMLKLAIAKKHKRLAVLDELHTRALTVIQERIADDDEAAPGQSTGLVVRQVKQIGAGKDARMVEEYGVDTALMREIRALQEQAARELGQLEDNVTVTHQGLVPQEYIIVHDVAGVPDRGLMGEDRS